MFWEISAMTGILHCGWWVIERVRCTANTSAEDNSVSPEAPDELWWTYTLRYTQLLPLYLNHISKLAVWELPWIIRWYHQKLHELLRITGKDPIASERKML